MNFLKKAILRLGQDFTELKPITTPLAKTTDAFIGPEGDKFSVTVREENLGEFDTEEEAYQALRDWGKEHTPYHNVWFVNENGETELIRNFDWENPDEEIDYDEEYEIDRKVNRERAD